MCGTGECPTIVVFDVAAGADVLQLPTDEITYEVCLTDDSLCYTDGKLAAMYGKGSDYSWRDPPSFRVVSSIINTMLTAEEQVRHGLYIILVRS